MYRLLLKFIHTQPGFHRSRVMENILCIDAQIYTSMSHAVFDCVSTINDVCTCLINHLFVCVWAFTQIQSYSTGFSPVLRHGKYPIYWRSDLRVDVARSIWMRIYRQQCVSVLNRSSICVCMGFYSNSIIFIRLRCRQQLRSHQCCILKLRSTNRCCTQHLIAYLLSTMC